MLSKAAPVNSNFGDDTDVLDNFGKSIEGY